MVLVMYWLLAVVAVGGLLALGFYTVVASVRQSRRLDEISDLQGVRNEMQSLRSNLKAEMQGLRTDVRNEVRGLRPDRG